MIHHWTPVLLSSSHFHYKSPTWTQPDHMCSHWPHRIQTCIHTHTHYTACAAGTDKTCSWFFWSSNVESLILILGRYYLHPGVNSQKSYSYQGWNSQCCYLHLGILKHGRVESSTRLSVFAPEREKSHRRYLAIHTLPLATLLEKYSNNI